MKLKDSGLPDECIELEKRLIESISNNDREGVVLLTLLKLIIETIEAQEFPNEARSFVIDSIIFAQTDSKLEDQDYRGLD